MDEKKLLLVIDSQNLFYALRDLSERDERLDFLKLREIACRKTKCSFVKAIVYFSTIREDLSALRSFLVCNGFEVPEPLFRKDVDSNVIVDTMKTYDQFDVVVIASGDADFLPLVIELKEQGKEVGIISFEDSIAKSLASAADWVINLDERIILNGKGGYVK